MAYMVALGHDNTAGLATVTPQPSCPGLKVAIRRHGGDGTVYRDGWMSASWHYGYHSPDRRVLTALLTQFGLIGGTYSRAVTVTLRDNGTNTFSNYNAVITMPDFPDAGAYEMGAWQEIAFELTQIRAI